jgi:hypothetical protein
MKRFSTNAVLLFISLTVAIALSEVFLRLYAPQALGTWDLTRDGLTTHVPNMTQYVKTYDQTVSTNSFGMRDREHAVEKAADVYRILLLGDSFMEAFQVRFEESFPHQLERVLNDSSTRKVEVINASVSGWGTDDELTYLVRYGRSFRPDLILVAMTLHNDVSDNLAEEFHTFSGGQLYEKPRQEIPFPDYAVLKVKTYLASHSHLTQLFYKFWRQDYVDRAAASLRSHVVDLIHQSPSDRVTMGWLMTERLLEKANSVAAGIGAKMAVFMIPLFIQVSDEGLAQFLQVQGLTREHINIDQPQQIMKRWGKEAGVLVIDLRPEFREWTKERGDTLFLENDGHWTTDGHRLAARIVSKQLMEHVEPGSSGNTSSALSRKNLQP